MRYLIRIAFLTVCCMGATFAAPRFLVISDIHYGSDNSAKDGQDTGTAFLALTMSKFSELTKDVDFILNLGDLPTHLLFVTPKKEEYERTLFHALFNADQHLKPMFYITGNNDSLTGNYQPFESDGISPLNFANDWTGACVYCDGLMIDDSHMRHDGYYSSYVMPENKNIMLIALNTIQWTKAPILAPTYPNQERDALAQLAWLEQQLKNHHAKQLIIAMHVPPGPTYNGYEFWHQRYLEAFIALLNKYHGAYYQISLLTSHTHMDGFRKITLKDGSAIYGYSIPGVSRIHHNNPGIKVFSMDDQYRIKDFITYYTSSFTAWGGELYHALGTPDAMFSDCQKVTLTQCLDTYNAERLCSRLEQGLFIGVKSDRIPDQRCSQTYEVR